MCSVIDLKTRGPIIWGCVAFSKYWFDEDRGCEASSRCLVWRARASFDWLASSCSILQVLVRVAVSCLLVGFVLPRQSTCWYNTELIVLIAQGVFSCYCYLGSSLFHILSALALRTAGKDSRAFIRACTAAVHLCTLCEGKPSFIFFPTSNLGWILCVCAFLVWTGSGADLGAGGPTAVVPPSSGWSRRGRPELRSLRRWTRSLWVYILLEGPFLHLLLLLLLLLLIPLLLLLLYYYYYYYYYCYCCYY